MYTDSIYNTIDLSMLIRGHVSSVGKNRIDELFLRYDSNRSGFIDKTKLRDMCKAISLPLDDDVMDAVSTQTSSTV